MAKKGTTDKQLEDNLKNIPYFVGVFAADQLPKEFDRTDAAFIANYSASDEGSGTHWVAFLHMNNTQKPPTFFDSFGFMPNDENKILDTHAHFEEYLTNQSKKLGHRGHFEYSKLNMQCVDGDVCGEFCAACIRFNCLPYRADGSISPEWRKVLSLRDSCERTEAKVKRFIGIRK